MHHIQLCPIAMSVSDVQEERSLEGALTSECKKCLWEVKCDMQTCAGVNDIVRGQRKECVYFIFYFFITIQAREFLEGDWLKCVVFQPNLEHLHVVFHLHGNHCGCVLIFKEDGGEVPRSQAQRNSRTQRCLKQKTLKNRHTNLFLRVRHALCKQDYGKRPDSAKALLTLTTLWKKLYFVGLKL